MHDLLDGPPSRGTEPCNVRGSDGDQTSLGYLAVRHAENVGRFLFVTQVKRGEDRPEAARARRS